MKFFSKDKNEPFFFAVDENESAKKEKIKNPTALTPEEVLGIEEQPHERFDSNSALDNLKKRLSSAAAGEDTEQKKPAPQTKKAETTEDETKKPSLLDKCMPYILDENGKEAVESEPLYKLQSVADILKADSEKTLKRISEKYDISFDDLGHSIYLSPEITDEPQATDVKPEITEEEKTPVKKEIRNI